MMVTLNLPGMPSNAKLCTDCKFYAPSAVEHAATSSRGVCMKIMERSIIYTNDKAMKIVMINMNDEKARLYECKGRLWEEKSNHIDL